MSDPAGSKDHVIDHQRGRVYAAEQVWALRLDAARRGARSATVAGSAVLLPHELLFGTLGAAQTYADARLVGWGLPPVLLRVRRGQSKAHWEAGSPAVIALPVPEHGEPWAMREAVLLHELAHHLAAGLDAEPGHGPMFPARLLQLVGQALGEQAAFALRVDYAEHRVQVAGRGVPA